MDPADGFGQLGGGAILEEIAFGSGVEGAAEIAWARECGKDDYAGLGVAVTNLSGQGKPSHTGHFNVSDENVGVEFRDGIEGLVSVGGAGADSDVGLGLKQRSERPEHHGLIFRDDDLDFRGHGLCSGRL